MTIEDLPFDSGTSNVPEEVKRKVSELIDLLTEYRNLKQGGTALYWHLLTTISKHIQEPKE